MQVVHRPENLRLNVSGSSLRRFALFAMLAASSGCKEDEGTTYDSGYGDGYAVGYNTECKIRATLFTLPS